MRVFKMFGMSIVAASALVVSTTTSSYADAGAGAGNFVECEPGTGGPHCVSGAISTRIYPTGLGLSVVEFECTIIGSIDPASVTINECTFAGVSAIEVPSTLPGAVITQVGVATVTTGGTYVQCIAGSANFLEALVGPPTVSGGTCSDAIALVTP